MMGFSIIIIKKIKVNSMGYSFQEIIVPTPWKNIQSILWVLMLTIDRRDGRRLGG